MHTCDFILDGPCLDVDLKRHDDGCRPCKLGAPQRSHQLELNPCCLHHDSSVDSNGITVLETNLGRVEYNGLIIRTRTSTKHTNLKLQLLFLACGCCRPIVCNFFVQELFVRKSRFFGYFYASKCDIIHLVALAAANIVNVSAPERNITS